MECIIGTPALGNDIPLSMRLMVQFKNKPRLVKVYNEVEKRWAQDFSTQIGTGNVARQPQEPAWSGVEEDGGTLGNITLLTVGGMLGFLGWSGIRRWRAGRVQKGSKLV
jgi:hypothetical protein